MFHIVGGSPEWSYPGVGKILIVISVSGALGVMASYLMERWEVQTSKGRARLTGVSSFDEPAGSGEANVIDERIRSMGMKNRCIMVQRARLD